MFYRVFFFLAVLAVAFASPKPDPQVLAYSAPGLVAAGYPYYGGLLGAAPYAYPYAYNPYLIR
ncbi:hypothetical protein KGM_204891 [Danaus plexippus plexippus]|uniref:Neuropeptide-like 4 n=1 Tax=Danaus plexippus plexippus TaxID=278856 RepID=A0A212FBH5_DANPL|nr:hypothetical protein KGM_204891 [Danaus plexippus plexippus]